MTRTWDTVIAGGLVFDGTGAPPQYVDLGIKDGRVTEIGSALPGEAADEVDASGQWVIASGQWVTGKLSGCVGCGDELMN